MAGKTARAAPAQGMEATTIEIAVGIAIGTATVIIIKAAEAPQIRTPKATTIATATAITAAADVLTGEDGGGPQNHQRGRLAKKSWLF